MEEYGAKIKEYKKRPKTGVIQAEMEGLEADYDRLTRDSFALEAIEYQPYRMRDAGASSKPGAVHGLQRQLILVNSELKRADEEKEEASESLDYMISTGRRFTL
jgi:hypothetical protein